MEVLKVEFYISTAALVDAGAGALNRTSLYVLTRSFGTVEPTITQGGGVLARCDIRNTQAATSTDMSYIFPIVFDLTDNAGHGVLVGTDQIFFGAGNAAGGTISESTGQATARILYRIKDVGITEYVGLVQSQQ